jgi:hypothetical protein
VAIPGDGVHGDADSGPWSLRCELRHHPKDDLRNALGLRHHWPARATIPCSALGSARATLPLPALLCPAWSCLAADGGRISSKSSSTKFLVAPGNATPIPSRDRLAAKAYVIWIQF